MITINFLEVSKIFPEKVSLFIQKTSEVVNKIALYISASLAFVMFAITIYGAFMRYVMGAPRPWPMPVARILMIWVSILGITVAFKKHQHVAVDSLRERVPVKVKKLLYILIYLLIALFAVVLVWKGWEVFLVSRQLYMITARLRLPYQVSIISLPISGVIHLIHILAIFTLMKEDFDKIEVSQDQLGTIETFGEGGD